MLKDFKDYEPLYDRFYIEEFCTNTDGELNPDFFKALHYATQLEKYSERDFRDFDYNDLKQLVKAIYGDNDQSEMIEVISIIQEKFIKGFINIPHLDDLFNEHYFEYEWEMHSRLDPDTKRVDFYRDHYFHQVRNLYEIFKFLQAKNHFILKNLIKEMKVSTGNTSRYCNHVIFEAKKLYLGNSEVYSKLFASLVVNKNKNMLSQDVKGLVDDYFEEYAMSYIIKGALYVAALTHDIGYPIGRHIQRNREFVRFVSNPAYNKNIFEFDHIRNIIDRSMLFDIVDADKIKKQLSNKKYGMDHGVISAIVLLIHFYEHGAIYELDPLKRAIIELAAIINYDHTADYAAIEEDEGEHRENFPRWKKNPMSIFFRVVDDIQEWDRVYFHVRPYPNIRICTKCKMPMLKQEFKPIEASNKNYYIVNEFTKYKHVCACMNGGEHGYELDYGAYKQQMSFNNQKINYVIASNRIYFIASDNLIEIFIDYNPYKLLELLMLNQGADFHKHRLEEIFKLKKFIELSESNLFKVTTFLHYEPEVLRQKIVYDFMAALYCIYAVMENRKGKRDNKISNFIYCYKDESLTQDVFKFDFMSLKNTIEKEKDTLREFLSLNCLKSFKSSSILACYRNILKPKKISDSQDNLEKKINGLIFEIINVGEDCSNLAKDLAPVLKNMFEEKIERDLFNKNNYASVKKKIDKNNNSLMELINSKHYLNVSAIPTETDKFYSYFYILGIMNDFTEMVKKFLSERLAEEQIV